VVGAGFGARVVAPAFAAAGCDVVDVVTARDTAAVEALCRRTDVELVSIHSPPFLHAPHVRLALAAGHHVLCDKPFAMNAQEAAELRDAAAAAGVLHFLNFEFRQLPVRRQMRGLVRDGVIGDVEHVQWTHISSGSRVPLRPHGWLFERDKGGGWIGAWGSHAIDTIRWMLGDIAEARAELRTTVRKRPDANGGLRECDAEDGFTASLTLETGVTVAIDTTFAATVSLAPRLTITGSEGGMECVADSRLTLRRADGTREELDVAAPPGDPHVGPMHTWAELIRDAVRDGDQVAPSFDDGWACDVVLDQLRAGRQRVTTN
jgi:predicted dehydrogenase